MAEQQKNNHNAHSDLPYERFLKNGAESLSDAELLAIILRTGTKGEDTVSIAKKILCLSSGRRTGLLGLHHLSVQELMTLKGIGEVKAVKIKCIAELSNRIAALKAESSLQFTDPISVADYYMERMRHEEREQILLVMMDNKNHLLQDMVISKGTVNASLITPREIMISALKMQAVYIMLVHNHPSGDSSPSRQDFQITKQLKEAADLIGIPLIDHIIIGDKTFTSFKEKGFL